MAVSIDRWAPDLRLGSPHRRSTAPCWGDAGRDRPALRSKIIRVDRRELRPEPSPARPQVLQPGAEPGRDWRRAHGRPAADARIPHRAARFSASSALWIWLACGLVLTLTCPPISSAQTWFGALPLWLVGLPAASLVAITMGSARR